MIISLEEAQTLDSTIQQADLDGLEVTVRNLTNNKFQNTGIRYKQLRFSGNQITCMFDVKGIRVGDTVEINDSIYYDGLYMVESVNQRVIGLVGADFENEFISKAILTKIEYPPDILLGVKKVLTYQAKMSSKLGIKSESVSRMSTTYFDVNAADNIDGLPAALFSFLNKYRKMRWS